MKNMNMKERYWTINLQLFAGDGGDDNPGDEGGEDDLSLIHISEPTRPY